MTHPDVNDALAILLGRDPGQPTQQEGPTVAEPMNDPRLHILEGAERDARVAVLRAKETLRRERQTDAQKTANALDIMRRANGFPRDAA